ncbi:helix-turn-helix domain-containing protein, partial [uncultured Deinococcus sp.]|uniref:winged helix-turn-helix transcriptional regulator n=1 Tax=uncultured Deinococcus sp. TaxID=158789 RepID=UPI00258E5EC7
MEVTPPEPCATTEELECGVRNRLGRIGDKWTVLVVVEVSPEPKRFRQLQRSVHAISQRVLTLTLRRLRARWPDHADGGCRSSATGDLR